MRVTGFQCIKVFTIITFLTATFLLLSRLSALRAEQRQFEVLSETVREIQKESGFPFFGGDQTRGGAAMLPEYAVLYEMNPDFAGWVQVEGTAIDYPVMVTPAEPEYYLHRDFFKEDSYAGTPFIGQGQTEPRSSNLFIYGHHMRNGTMFADLIHYQSQDFWQKHPKIRFDTCYEHQEYEIFAAGYSKGDWADPQGGVYRFIDGDSASYEEYVQLLRQESFYDTGIVPGGEPLLVLVTCSYQEEDGRLWVAGRKILD